VLFAMGSTCPAGVFRLVARLLDFPQEFRDHRVDRHVLDGRELAGLDFHPVDLPDRDGGQQLGRLGLIPRRAVGDHTPPHPLREQVPLADGRLAAGFPARPAAPVGEPIERQEDLVQRRVVDRRQRLLAHQADEPEHLLRPPVPAGFQPSEELPPAVPQPQAALGGAPEPLDQHDRIDRQFAGLEQLPAGLDGGAGPIGKALGLACSDRPSTRWRCHDGSPGG
jgi:hypothetical protein